MPRTRAREAARTRAVRVTRNGNARTLTVPAEIATAQHIEVGDEYTVEAINGDLFFRRADRTDTERPRGYFVGEGCNRVYVLPKGASFPVGPDPSPAPPLDWDF